MGSETVANFRPYLISGLDLTFGVNLYLDSCLMTGAPADILGKVNLGISAFASTYISGLNF